MAHLVEHHLICIGTAIDIAIALTLLQRDCSPCDTFEGCNRTIVGEVIKSYRFSQDGGHRVGNLLPG